VTVLSENKPKRAPKPLILVILDGWGHRDERADNAIATAKTPVLDRLTSEYPNGLINASELHVGLPLGQMGNSEVGHMNIGSGRVLMQDLPRIDAAIADGSLGRNPRFIHFIKSLALPVCHLLGLVSPGGVHAHHRHMIALAQLLAGQGIAVRIHAMLDGRDTPPQSAKAYMASLEQGIAGLPNVAVATVSGRYYAMDRDKRWDRVQKAYDTITAATGPRFATAQEAIDASYAAGVTDEFFLPCAIGDYQGMRDGEGLMAANFRADRVREILTALLDPAFAEFPRGRMVHFAAALGMTEYSSKLNHFLHTLFPPEPLTRIFGEIISEAGLKQLRIAETEKYAHVTFFFNGGREEEFPGEERILVPSPKVPTYDLQPEMSAPEVTDKLVAAIQADRYDVIVVNYANTDMVGHTGDIEAARKAVETVDSCLERVIDATLARGGALLITADHGNAEMMFDHDTEQPHTAHTLNLVPVIMVSASLKGKHIPIREGKLGDVAPTLLQMLGLPQPPEMTGRSLLDAYEAA
jgi:2,3-bisphosphoglycerate-independent phosphoglycerate mutase